MFPAGIADAANWRNLIFGGWWSWLEKWGKLVSILLGVYYLYVVGRWLLTTLFSLRVLYQEHGFSPNLLWGLGPGQNIFYMWFYRQWRRFKQHFSHKDTYDQPPRVPWAPVHHEYLAIHEDEGPPLPRRNRAVSNVYPLLPDSKMSLTYANDHQAIVYPSCDRRVTVRSALECTPLYTGPSVEVTPPAADSRAVRPAIPTGPRLATANLVGLPPPRSMVPSGLPDNLLPKGRNGDVMKHWL